uniref:U2 small nuclear RNA auxiliary factor 1 like 4 n=1 Tax=Saimiri boliviensis boliviensis TaxID=39432 RepID=A0A2K6UI41_SAIBB
IAEYLASIFGTEKDKVNCSFYLKIGACRHGDRCSRLHNKPTFSQEVFTELQEKYGEIEEMNVYDNLRNHLVGNIYVKFRREEDAERAVAELHNRWFNGQGVHGNVPKVASATSCICGPFPETSGSSSMGGDPGAGHRQGPILATVLERETAGIPQITGMAASEDLAALPFATHRNRCSWQDLSSKPPSLSCPVFPRLPGFIM